MITSLLNLDEFTIKQVFLPHGTGQYYRPILYLTFIADKYIWSLEPSFMHLGNILLHLGNTLLVFWIARLILSSPSNLKSYSYAPFATALLFGLHPIATEPVNWVSGRTDLLAGFFVLLSFGLFLVGAHTKVQTSPLPPGGGGLGWGGSNDEMSKSQLHPPPGPLPSREGGAIFKTLTIGSHCYNYLFGFLGALSLLAGCLSKETALFVLPVILAWCVFPPKEENNPLPSRDGEKRKGFSVSLRVYLFTLYGAAGTIYLLLRWLALSGGDKIVKTVVKVGNASTPETSVGFFDVARVISKTAGFYFKKLIIPVPLNFGINSISPHYFWLGLLVLCGVAWCIYRRDTVSYLFLAAFMLTSSAFLLPILKITWTPIAERYVYMASAPFLIAVVVLYIQYLADRFSARVTTLVVATVLGSAAVVTAQRNIIWQDNFTLFEDTIKKSPEFPTIRNEFAIALRGRGRIEEADKIMLANTVDEFQPSSLNKIRILANQGKLDEARLLLLERIKKPSEYDLMKWELLLTIDQSRLEKAKTDADKRLIDNDILAGLQKLAITTGDPFYHYRLGIVQMRLGDKPAAKASFEKAWQGAAKNSHYREAAKKLAEKL